MQANLNLLLEVLIMESEVKSHQEHLEKALEISKGIYKTLILTSPDAISATDVEGDFIFISPQSLKLHGYENEEELLGKNSLKLIDPANHDEIISNFEIAQKDGILRNIEYRSLKKDGTTFPAELSIATLVSPAGNIVGYIITMRDISDRKKLEDQLRQAYKMEAFGLLAGRFAHDFNNFLQIIRGYSELIMTTADPPDYVIDNLNEIRKAESKAEFLVEQLLAFGRKQILKLSNINLNTMITDMKEVIKTTIGENIELKLGLDKELSIIRIDPVQISQVIINILFNARDAIEDTGIITIKTQNIDLSKDFVSFPLEIVEGKYVELSISDTGSGIPNSIWDKVFQPFFTTKEMGKGTGLGLASVYGIVKQSNGYIFFDSDSGGTTFRIYLPKIDALADNTLVEDTINDASALKGKEKILLVEDDDLVRTYIENLLRTYGYKVRSARDGHQALSRLNGIRKIDLFITDVVLPKMNGRQVANKILEKHPLCKVLYIYQAIMIM